MDDRPAFLSVPAAILVGAAIIAASIIFIGSGGPASILGFKSSTPKAQATPGPSGKIDMKTVLDDEDPVLGKADAKVTIVEFSDFQCPFCRAFYNDTFAQLKKEYIDTGKAKLIYRDFPLTSLHPAARPAALAGACAQEQGKFWEFHDMMYAQQDQKDPSGNTVSFTATDIKAWAAGIPGLDTGKFNQCLDSEKYADEVDKDQQAGAAAGVDGTPSFFVNGTPLVGAQPFSAFKEVIDAALAD